MDTGANKIFGNYVKSSDFDVKHVTGAIGGINPQGDVVVNFYSEQAQLPTKYCITADDKGNVVVDESTNETGEALQRIFQNGIVMNLGTAKSIATWLNNMIEEFENANTNNKQ